MDIKSKIVNILKSEVVPATGCTEPVALALASARAMELYGNKDFDTATVLTSANVFKNALCVGIPNCEHTGLSYAVALGLSKAASGDDLRILEKISDNEKATADSFIELHKIKLGIADVSDSVYISVELKSKDNYAIATIRGKHNNFVHLESATEGVILKDTSLSQKATSQKDESIYEMKVIDLIKHIETIEFNDIAFLLDGITMNEKAARLALENKLGIGVGYGIKANIEKGLMSKDLINTAMMLTAAASDARMSGLDIPVMSSNGSGNHGLTAILPIVAFKEIMDDISDDKLATSLAISHIITGYIKNYTGRLTPLCGCGVAAGVGSAVAIGWLLDSTDEQLEGIINNMVANTAGIICDGAKVGCALKLATSASAAVSSALLAKEGMIVPDLNGIVGHTVEESIKNIGKLSVDGMNYTDKMVLEVMRDMQNAVI